MTKKAELEIVNDPRAFRRKLGLSQQVFWNRIGLTQSAGSRYENDRRLPEPVKRLLVLEYVRGVPTQLAA